MFDGIPLDKEEDEPENQPDPVRRFPITSQSLNGVEPLLLLSHSRGGGSCGFARDLTRLSLTDDRIGTRVWLDKSIINKWVRISAVHIPLELLPSSNKPLGLIGQAPFTESLT
jgi:hypothetical protein